MRGKLFGCLLDKLDFCAVGKRGSRNPVVDARVLSLLSRLRSLAWLIQNVIPTSTVLGGRLRYLARFYDADQ